RMKVNPATRAIRPTTRLMTLTDAASSGMGMRSTGLPFIARSRQVANPKRRHGKCRSLDFARAHNLLGLLGADDSWNYRQVKTPHPPESRERGAPGVSLLLWLFCVVCCLVHFAVGGGVHQRFIDCLGIHGRWRL